MSLLGPGLNGFTGGSFNFNAVSFMVVEGAAAEQKSLDDAMRDPCLGDVDTGFWEGRRQNDEAIF
jgi:hypothetical protein